MKALGIILAGGNNYRMRELSSKRAIAAMPIGGSFRAIDFALSSMSNSHIQKAAVLTQYNARSLHEHLSSSKWWDFGRKQGGLYVFTPTITEDNESWYRGTADALYQNIDFLKRSHEPYVIIGSGDCVYKLDFNKLLDYHVAKGADITVVCKEMPPETDLRRFGVLHLDEDERIIGFEEKPMVAQSGIISAGIYVFRRRGLIEMLEKSNQEQRFDLVADLLIRYKSLKKICAYRLESYWSNIASEESYYQTNMDFLDPQIRNYFFKQKPHVFSKVEDLAPAKYNPGADVKNSLVASGCILNGEVENSLLFKKVFVGSHCRVRNSIILNDVYIGDCAEIENCIIESDVVIPDHSRLTGGEGVHIVKESMEKTGEEHFGDVSAGL